MSLSKPKFILLACLLACLVSGITFFVMRHAPSGTVRDFSDFPYAIETFDRLVLTQHGQSFEIAREAQAQGETWRIVSPIEASLGDWGISVLQRLSKPRSLFIDIMEPAQLPTQEDYRRLPAEETVTAEFLRDGRRLAKMTFGKGKREATANAERRWVFVDGDETAYRVFTPLYDFGTPFFSPMRAWRDTRILSLDAHVIRAIHYRTAQDVLTLDRQGTADETNPQGWRVADFSSQALPSDVLKNFRIDERRVATILDLLSPLYADDMADGVSWSSLVTHTPSASIEIRTDEKNLTLEIGPEIDLKQWPAFTGLGEEARFAHMKGDETTFILSGRRLLGLMPSIHDLRTKKIWRLRTDTLSGVEVTVGERTLFYRPSASKTWQAEEAGTVSEVREAGLVALIKGLSGLEALRYATAEEASVSLQAARIRIYENGDDSVAHQIVFSEPQQALFRFARVDDGPIFAISEGLADMLLTDIRQTNAYP